MLIIVSISVYLSLFSITIILQSIEIDEQLLQVADGLPTLSVDTYYKRGRRENFSCSADKQREREGKGEGEGEAGSDKGCGRVIEFDNIDSLSTLTLFGDGIYSNSPTIHYKSEESGDLSTLLFNTCDDKNKRIITGAGNTHKYPSYVISSIFDFFFPTICVLVSFSLLMIFCICNKCTRVFCIVFGVPL